MASIEIIDPRFKEPITYYMEDWVKSAIDNNIKPALMSNDKDFLICIDGAEGGGKSWMSFQLGKYIDPTLDLSRVVFNAEDFRKAIFKAKKGQVIIYDEAFTGLSSRASLSGVNRALVSLMMQMRQKNLCIILVLPTFFLLDKYAALFRARVLFHVYESKGKRGYFRCYSKRLKKLLYIYGKKDYSYPRNIHIPRRLRGRFYGVFALGDKEEEEKYRKMKAKALEDTEKNPMNAAQVKYREQRDLLMFLLAKEVKLSSRKMSNMLSDYDLEISHNQISKILGKFGDIVKKKDEIDENNEEIEDNDDIIKENEVIEENEVESDDF